MNHRISEDVTTEKLRWLIECIDEMFSDLEERESGRT